jgi:hypothetical protein
MPLAVIRGMAYASTEYKCCYVVRTLLEKGNQSSKI